jgi:enoyl-CoA hydratase
MDPFAHAWAHLTVGRNGAAGAGNHAATFMDRDQYLLTSRSADFHKGVAAFLAKRPPNFQGD